MNRIWACACCFGHKIVRSAVPSKFTDELFESFSEDIFRTISFIKI